MNILITICARGGSKGIPGKNIKIIGGKPLIAYSIELAKKLKEKLGNTTIALSTDSIEIKDVAKQFDLSTDYLRPDVLSSDDAGKIDAINDLVIYSENENNKVFDYIIDLDVTSPLRTVEDVCLAFEQLKSNTNALNIFSVSNADRNPYFNMVEINEEGFATLVKKANFLTRQSSPKVYALNASFYIYKRLFFTDNYKGAITDKSLIFLVPHICFDLDHPIDFEFMDYLMINKKIDLI